MTIELVHNDEVVTRLENLGIGFDESYPGARSLTYLPHSDHARFWTLLPDPAGWPHFVDCLLEGCKPWSSCFLWPRFGTWPATTALTGLSDSILNVILRGVGIPEAWPGAIRFAPPDRPAVLAVVFFYLVFGGCVQDDLYLIPDHGRQILLTSHHDVVHVKFAEESRIESFVKHMSAAGYELPAELPDETFKRPAWMKTLE